MTWSRPQCLWKVGLVSLVLALYLGNPVEASCTEGDLVAAPVCESPAEASPESNISAPAAAPSPAWLVIMPAIPLAWGGLIYLKRRWFAGPPQNSTTVSVSVAEPDLTGADQSSTPADETLETDSNPDTPV